MTERFIRENGITESALESLEPGARLGPFNQGYGVDPEIRRGDPNAGYPDARLIIERNFPRGYTITNLLTTRSRSIETLGSPQKVMDELRGDTHSAVGEIRNKGE